VTRGSKRRVSPLFSNPKKRTFFPQKNNGGVSIRVYGRAQEDGPLERRRGDEARAAGKKEKEKKKTPASKKRSFFSYRLVQIAVHPPNERGTAVLRVRHVRSRCRTEAKKRTPSSRLFFRLFGAFSWHFFLFFGPFFGPRKKSYPRARQIKVHLRPYGVRAHGGHIEDHSARLRNNGTVVTVRPSRVKAAWL
jgi:hypothetical protein